MGGEAEPPEGPSRDDSVFREEFKDMVTEPVWESVGDRNGWAARVCEVGRGE